MSIAVKLKAHIESLPENQNPESNFRVSSAGSCLRMLDYDGMYGSAPHDELTHFRFEVGHAIDKLFKDLLRSALGEDFMGMDEELRLQTPKGMVVIGHPDGRLLSENAVVEVKSCSNSIFERVQRTAKPLNEHFEQANLYAHALNAAKIIFIYFNKNSARYLIVEAHYNLGQAIYNLEKFDLAHENRLNKVISPRMYHDEAESPCYYCGHRERCYAGFNQEASDLKVKQIQSPILEIMAGLFHDARKLRLDTEKVEDSYAKPLVEALVNGEEAQDLTVKGKRSFRIKIKPAPKTKAFTLKVKELDANTEDEDE
jgi:hypothetical protein